MSNYRRRLIQLIKKAEPKRVKCLISTGIQYIDTGIIPTSDMKVEMDFEVARTTTEFYFGSRTSSSSQDNYSFLQYISKFRSDYGTTIEKDNIININTITGYPKFHIIKDKNITTINDVTITRPEAEFQGGYPLYLFCVNTKGWANTFSNIKLYYLKIYEENVLVRDFIPMLDENSIPCLYDSVEGIYYYNRGSGEFEFEYIDEYIQDGLVLYVDGIHNTVNGHKSDSLTWEDLSGNGNDLILENIVWENNCAVFNNSIAYCSNKVDNLCVEIVMQRTDGLQTAVYIGYFGNTRHSVSLKENVIVLSHATKGYELEAEKITSISAQYKSKEDYVQNCYINGVKKEESDVSASWANVQSYYIRLGNYSNNYKFKGKIYAIRIYDRVLTKEDIKHNYEIDKQRFYIE